MVVVLPITSVHPCCWLKTSMPAPYSHLSVTTFFCLHMYASSVQDHIRLPLFCRLFSPNFVFKQLLTAPSAQRPRVSGNSPHLLCIFPYHSLSKKARGLDGGQHARETLQCLLDVWKCQWKDTKAGLREQRGLVPTVGLQLPNMIPQVDCTFSETTSPKYGA